MNHKFNPLLCSMYVLYIQEHITISANGVKTMASKWGTLWVRQAATASARQLESSWSSGRHPDGMGSGPAGIDYLNQFEFQLPVGGKRNLESSSPCRSGSNSHPGSSCRGTHVRVRKRVEPVVGDALIRVRDYEIPGKEAQGEWSPKDAGSRPPIPWMSDSTPSTAGHFLFSH